MTAHLRRIPTLAARLAGATVIGLTLAACSMTSDPDTLFGLSPSAVSQAANEAPDLAATTETEADADAAVGFAPAASETPAVVALDAEAAPETVAEVLPEAVPEATTVAAAEATPVPPQEKRSFLAGLFSTEPAQPRAPQAQRAERPLLPQPAPEAAKPIVSLAAIAPAQPPRERAYNDALPGVRSFDSLFEINRSDGLSTDADIDVYEAGGSYQVASLAPGLARLAPNGLRTQTASVDVKCLQPTLVRTLKSLESHFGKPVIVTSGFRSPEHNKRVRGARASYHMRCAAADVQVVGVDKHRVATYLRALPGRGGVGTYCSHSSVHVDVGPKRDWNWRCRS